MPGPTPDALGFTRLGYAESFPLSPGDSFSATGFVEIDPVLEPAEWVLAGGGLVLLGALARRSRRPC